MVGGFVQQQQVGARQHQTGQIDPGLFAAGQAHKGASLHIGVDLQTAGHAVIGHLQVIAAAVLEGGLQSAVAVQIHLLSVGHKCLHAAHFLAHAFQPGEGLPQHFLYRGVGVIDGQLLQKTQTGGLVDGHHAAVVLGQTGNDLQQGGLAAAVGADDAGALSRLQVKGESLEDVMLSKVFMKLLYADFCHFWFPPETGDILWGAIPLPR